MKDEKNDIVNELIPRYLAGETSIEEEKQLLDWIAQDAKNERYYLGIKKTYDLSGVHYADKAIENLPINVDQEWTQFINTISKIESTPVRKLQPKESTSGIWYKIAASLFLIATAAFVINYFATKNNEFSFKTANNTLTVPLPDGSQVVLNRHSQLTYTSDFGNETRNVDLVGEAFFEVTHDAQKHFIVNVNNTLVEVLGTSFNIRAYDTFKQVEVIVKTGTVKFSVPEQETNVQLTAGQKGLYTPESKNLDRIMNEDPNFISWRTQHLVFEEINLRSVIETLNKTYGANITIATDIPPTCEVTVTFDHQTLEAVLHVLETTLNLTYKITGNQIEIISAGC